MSQNGNPSNVKMYFFHHIIIKINLQSAGIERTFCYIKISLVCHAEIYGDGDIFPFIKKPQRIAFGKQKCVHFVQIFMSSKANGLVERNVLI